MFFYNAPRLKRAVKKWHTEACSCCLLAACSSVVPGVPADPTMQTLRQNNMKYQKTVLINKFAFACLKKEGCSGDSAPAIAEHVNRLTPPLGTASHEDSALHDLNPLDVLRVHL